MYAAIDTGTICGAVYGVGATPEEALADALESSGDPGSRYDVVPITPAAAAWVRGYGGEPEPCLDVRSSGVRLELTVRCPLASGAWPAEVIAALSPSDVADLAGEEVPRG